MSGDKAYDPHSSDAKPLRLRVFYQTPTGSGCLDIEQDHELDMLNVRVSERRGMTTLAQGVMLDPGDAERIGNALLQWGRKPRILLGEASPIVAGKAN